MQRQTLQRLSFPIGDNDYEIHPVGIDAGHKLAEIFTASPALLAKSKVSNIELFELALGRTDPSNPDSVTVWDQMRADGVPFQIAYRAGMAALAHFQVLLRDTTPNAWDTARQVAEAVWESGIDPEALAAYMAANNGTAKTPRSTRQAAAPTTQRRASGTGTRKTATPARKTAPRSGGTRSARSGH